MEPVRKRKSLRPPKLKAEYFCRINVLGLLRRVYYSVRWKGQTQKIPLTIKIGQPYSSSKYPSFHHRSAIWKVLTQKVIRLVALEDCAADTTTVIRYSLSGRVR